MTARVSRRSALKVGGACLGAGLAPAAGWGQPSSYDPLQRWIQQSAIPIRPGASEGWSDRDVQRLAEVIGDARVVLLGEPSHGSGAAFAAKARLVRLLHERLGFDSLVWESGLIDLERTEAGLRGEAEPVEAAQRGILKIWSASEECRPLFAYAKASHSTARPLTMAGFDMQLTAGGTLDYFANELRPFIRNFDSTIRPRAEELSEKVLHHIGHLWSYTEALAKKNEELGRSGLAGPARSAALRTWQDTEGEVLRPVSEDCDRLNEAASALVHLLSAMGSLSNAATTQRAGFMVRAITGLAGFGSNLFEKYGEHSPEEEVRYAVSRENRRDRINADTLKWLIDTAYVGRKIMVWAHNAHVMNAWYGKGFDSVSLKPTPDGMKTTGVWLADWFGPQVFKIGFTAWQGTEGFVGAPPTPVPPAPPDSIEERLHRLGVAELLLPWRGSRRSRSLPPGPVSMRIPKWQTETVANAAQPFDALYFIDKMTAATLIGRA